MKKKFGEIRTNDSRQQKLPEKLVDQKRSRFGSVEFCIVVAVIFAIVILCFPIIIKFTQHAEKSNLESNAYSIYLATFSVFTFNADSISDEDIKAFVEKYDEYISVDELKKGKLVIEKSIMSFLNGKTRNIDTSNSDETIISTNNSSVNIKGYIRFEYHEGEGYYIYLSNSQDGSNAVSAP